jgi:hypothetical protein
MRRLLALLLVLGTAGVASAVQVGTTMDLSGKGQWLGDGAVDGREGGEDAGSPVVIGGLPFSDTGATCDNINDYDEICPYSGSTSADVVYSFTPGADVAVSIDLCASTYDTKVYVYAGGVGILVACNDDAGCGYSGWQSLIDNLSLTAGVTYYIVVDGYGGSCGSYDIQIGGFEPCVVECPAGGIHEAEPPCVDNYFDNYNGGCNSPGFPFQIIDGDADGCVDLCGKSCTYLYQGLSYRDTDWFEVYGNNENLSCTWEAEFPLQAILIYGTDCNNLQYVIGSAGPCTPVTLTWFVGTSVPAWLWTGASVFSGIPESDYVMNICGLEHGEVPVEETSWGAIKNLYNK